MMSRSLVGVLMGGPSSEHDISLMTGSNILKTLQASGRWRAAPIIITKTGHWLYGDDRVWCNPGEAIARADVICMALHGAFGEDGKAQQLLDHHSVPYTGSGIFASASAMNKIIARRIFQSAHLLTPKGMHMRRYGNESFEMLARRALKALPPPWIVKPAANGSSVGVSIAHHFDDLAPALKKAAGEDGEERILVEEYIKGSEITCGVLEHFNGAEHFALPPIEICPQESAPFFDYHVKYDGSTNEICPAEFSEAMLKKIRETAVAAHTALGCRDYSRTDMILRGTNLYVLEANTLPGLTKESLFPKAAAAAGLSFSDLLDHLITRALERRRGHRI